MTNVIQNDQANVQNTDLVKAVENHVVEKSTQEIFDQMVGLESVEIMSEIMQNILTAELRDASFMTINLELNEQQKERLLTSCHMLIQRTKSQYLAKIDKDQRTEKVAGIVKGNLKNILEEMLSTLAKEVNRGALINCVAVAADTKSEKYNKIELNSYKTAGDITIPTRCLLMSTNCLDLIKNRIDAPLDMSKKAARETVDEDGVVQDA